MSRALHRLGRAAVERRRLVVVLWIVAAVAIGLGSRAAGGGFSDDFRIPGVESQRAFDLLRERFPERSGATAQVVFHVDEGDIAALGSAAAITSVLDRVEHLPLVAGVVDPLTADIVSPDRHTALATVQYRGDVTDVGLDGFADLEAAIAPARDAGLQVELGGDLAQYASEPETETAELLGVLGAMVILLLAFGSVIAMGLPIGIALFGLVTGVSLVTLLGSIVEISTTAPTVASMIGIGVGIDYALFVVTRHRQHLVEGMTVAESAGRAIATAGQAVIIAGGTVVIAICGLALAGIPMVATMGYAAAVVVAVMVLASITLLPALLGFAGLRLQRATLPWTRRREAEDLAWDERLERLGAPGARRTGWERWGDHVARHPWRYLVASVATLLVLSAPVLGLRLGQADAGSSPDSTSIRRAYDLVADGFGPGFNGPLLIAVDLPAGTDGAALDRLVAGLAADPAVAFALPPDLNAAGDTAVLGVIPATAPQDQATSQLVHRIRDEIAPAALAGSGAEAHVGGLTAVFIDLADKVAGRLPWFIGAVVLLSFLLLMVVFRSILVPLKAALMNVLSIGAAYGVVVAVFQWGWLKGLVGLEETVPIVAFVPMFMFAILFGLSMDYEVFLLSRVREEYLIRRSNTESVIEGLASTARVITSAALIMICVFFGFVLGDDPIVKMMGLGLATAVFVDATIVRVVLVPASMRLLGDANWWLPRWLDRWLPHLDVEGTAGLPEPELREQHPSTDDEDLRHPDEVLAGV